ncbi:eCIS core domain-containing protein [Streptomyces asoensis]
MTDDRGMRSPDQQDTAARPARPPAANARPSEAAGTALSLGGPTGPVGLLGLVGRDAPIGLGGPVGLAGPDVPVGPVGASGPAGGGVPPSAGQLLALQRTAGNAAVVRALDRQRQPGHHTHGPSCGHQDPAPVQRRTQGPAQGRDDSAAVRRPEHGPSCGHPGSTPVQRHAHGPSCGHDGSLPVQRSSVPDVLRASGQPLDGTVRAEMEARMGADFSDVRLHTGPTAQRSAAEVGARAYTSGSHVVIGAGGADRHTLAHELTHVIQQRQGPVAGTDNGSGLSVSDPSDRFERAAEDNARRVLSAPVPTGAPPVQRTAAAPADGAPVQRTEATSAEEAPVQRTEATPAEEAPVQRTAAPAPVPTAGGPIAVQRAGDGEAFFDHAQYYAKTGWQEAAEQFEKQLGAYTFRHPRSLDAARKSVHRLKQLLIAYARTEHKDVALANKSFFKDDKTSGGQVGIDLTTAQINEFFARDGNVRELMTALYNAAYYNTAAELSLKQILNAIIGPKPQLASTLHMNEEQLKKHSAFLNGWSRPPLWAAASLKGKGYNYEKDPYALGNLLWQSESETLGGDTLEMINSQGPRKERSEADKEAHRKTPRDYVDRGAPLSDRELAFAGKPGMDDKLPWNEGAAYWEIQQNESWPKANAARGIPVVAGMSGTTTRMLKTFQWIKVPGVDVFDYRMAVMGWMLPSWDHSLYEILRGSWAAGVKGPKESALKADKGAALMYQHIAPFTEEELRQNVCVGGHFPHELMYVTEAGKPRTTDPATSGFMEPGRPAASTVAGKYNEFAQGDTAPTPRIAKWKADNGGASTAAVTEKFKPAHATALMAYTGGAHQMINSVVRSRLLPEGYAPYGTGALATAGAEALSLRQIKSQLSWAAQNDSPQQEWVPTLNEDPVIEPQLAAARGTDPVAKKAAMAVIDARIDVLAPVLFEELKAHADMTMEALTRLPPVTGTVFRGDWNAGGDESVYRLGKQAALNYRPGSIFTSSFDSTSREKSVGLDFMRGQRVSGTKTHRILLELTLTGKYGRDIDPFHQYQGTEAEVLLMPGAGFRVDKSEWVQDPGHVPANGGSDWYEHVWATEA